MERSFSDTARGPYRFDGSVRIDVSAEILEDGEDSSSVLWKSARRSLMSSSSSSAAISMMSAADGAVVGDSFGMVDGGGLAVVGSTSIAIGTPSDMIWIVSVYRIGSVRW